MKKIVILGAGESGVGSAILAKKTGCQVFVSDKGSIKQNYISELEHYGIAYEQGHHSTDVILGADEVIKSPGIPDTAPLIVALRKQGTPVISEIEFAARHSHATFLCVTGSNGKTTTTSLLYHILDSAGLDVGLGGNIGKSLARQVALHDRQYYVLELSSFQLDGMYQFHAHIAILLNITPDHLDRYDHNFMNYARAKMRITQNQTAEDYFIYWADDPVIRQMLAEHPCSATALPFDDKHSYADFDIAKTMTLQGRHNLYNATAAVIAALKTGIGQDKIKSALATFQAIEHRLEPVTTINGVRFVNDSKATNVDSCYYALESMTTPVVLILGGKDKGNDYTQIDNLIHQKVHTLVFMGINNEPLRQHFAGCGINIIDTDNIADAVSKAYHAARTGDTVLLSPCCASFDLFSSYEDRGRQFKQQVSQLT